MPYNALLGVGREPQFLGGLVNYKVEHEGNIHTPASEHITEVNKGYCQVLYAIVSIKVTNTQVNTGLYCKLFIDEWEIVKYNIPTGTIGEVINERIPLGITLNKLEKIKLLDGAPTPSGTVSYAITCNVVLTEAV